MYKNQIFDSTNGNNPKWRIVTIVLNAAHFVELSNSVDESGSEQQQWLRVPELSVQKPEQAKPMI